MLKGRGSSVLAINALQIRQPSPPGRHTSLRVHSRRETCREWTYRIKNDNQGKNSGEYCSRTLACLLPAMVLCVAFVCKSDSWRKVAEPCHSVLHHPPLKKNISDRVRMGHCKIEYSLRSWRHRRSQADTIQSPCCTMLYCLVDPASPRDSSWKATTWSRPCSSS